MQLIGGGLVPPGLSKEVSCFQGVRDGEVAVKSSFIGGYPQNRSQKRSYGETFGLRSARKI